ncbi:MAG: PLP-dependent aspartate aminotransferase family protein [Planctomycetota bacterium]
MPNDPTPGFDTRAVHTGVNKDTLFCSATTPIYPSSTFYWQDLSTNSGYDYTRSGNPTRRALEENLASLEGGLDCRATASGMSAVMTALHLFKAGDHVIAGTDIYGGTYRLMADVCPQLGIDVTFADYGEPGAIEAALRPNTKGVWIETPSNPLMNVYDVRAICRFAGSSGLVTIADNTFLSPYFQKPLELGCDVVVHSTTKYLNGHSDVVGGAVICKQQEHADRVAFVVNAMGLGQSPFDAFLVLRGAKTLGPRMEAHEKNANAIARFLAEHPKVTRVRYPGLVTDPGHELAKSQQTGFGAIVALEVDGDKAGVERMLSHGKYFLLAESLGGIESLWSYPDTMTHASMDEAARRVAGITEQTVRLSVGIENVDDLIGDLDAGLGRL